MMFNYLQIYIFVTDILIFLFFLLNKLFTDLRFAVDYCIVCRMIFHCSQFYIYIFVTDSFNIYRAITFLPRNAVLFLPHTVLHVHILPLAVTGALFVYYQH